ncbi:MAG: N-acetyltransferase [Candidatus Nitronauta litoralis]|uniref:N-acetyltransferase n=1 Tax=Candidatus Nitronauta litoralis TaxID=2705533 RepID=A0A7T0BWL4_9BACT|nr:MAG: N-acetyltransferase [Candidatus Nitronauta litoralis]
MTSKLEIRQSRPSDLSGIEQLYKDAFPDEDLLPLVRTLQGFGPGVKSLVGKNEKEIAGHICFTFCHIEGSKNKVALLGPLAVTPALHRQGVGSALVHRGLKHLENCKTGSVFVLGDPAYYCHFGFKAEDKVKTPYPLPTDWHGAWQSIRLCNSEPNYEGKLLVPEPWRQIELWTS